MPPPILLARLVGGLRCLLFHYGTASAVEQHFAVEHQGFRVSFGVRSFSGCNVAGAHGNTLRALLSLVTLGTPCSELRLRGYKRLSRWCCLGMHTSL